MSLKPARDGTARSAKSPTPVLDKVAVLMFIIALGMVGTILLLRTAPEFLALAKSRTHRDCGRVAAWRGLRQHRQANEAAPQIKQQSSLLQSDRTYRLWKTPQGSYWV